MDIISVCYRSLTKLKFLNYTMVINNPFVYAFFFLSIFALGLHFIQGLINYPPLIDEKFHYRQMISYLAGDFTQDSKLTTIPGFHAFFAAIAYALNMSTLQDFRLLSLLAVLVSVVVYYRCVLKLNPDIATPRALAFFFLPVMFPYNFLVYTHSLSMLTILLGVYFFLDKRFKVSALFIGLSVMVRQPNIVWVIWLALMFIFENQNMLKQNKPVTSLLKGLQPYGLVMLLFGLFIIFNNGVAMGDKEAQHIAINTGNSFFFMFCFLILLLPNIVFYRGKYRQIIVKPFTHFRREPVSSVLPWAVTILFVILFWFSYDVVHPYNRWMSYLHNILANSPLNSFWIKVMWVVAIGFTIMSMFIMPLSRQSAWLLYPISWLLLLLHPLIEHRYYIPVFSLLLMFRAPLSKKQEWFQFGYFVCLSSVILLLHFGFGLKP